MQKISETFNTTLKNKVRKNKENYYIIRTTNRKSNTKMVNYLNKYPLFSSKYLDFIDWLNIYNLMDKDKNSINNISKNIDIILKIKNSMNNQRTYYNWDHLNKFYILN